MFGGAKPRGIIAVCILLLEISGDRKRAWGNRGLSVAVPKNGGVSSVWQKIEWHGRTHSIVSSSNSSSEKRPGDSRSGCFASRFFSGPATSRSGGGRFGLHGGGFEEMNDEFVFTMDTPVNGNYFFDPII